ncbi:MAG: CotH kinase family protein [Bacteroidales bacterium]|nr:CotH kinase family protein [Bacteroidales bacterium]
MKRLVFAIAFVIMTSTAYSQIVINEFCTASDTLAYKGYVSDWIELYNAGTEIVNLKNYGLSDNPKKPRKHVIDCDAWISPGRCKIVLCNGIGKGLNTKFKLSGDGNETILLSDPSEEIIDQVTTPMLRDDYSYGRISDGSDKWGVFDVATPGKKNGREKALSEMPVFSVGAGFYSSAMKVAITSPDPSATIYYTIDGSLPTLKSNKYSSAINISRNTVLRAIAVSDGHKASAATTATYFIRERQMTLPVVAISTDRANFYDDQIGIYVAGTNGISGRCSDNPVNWNQDWERCIHVEYFDKNLNLQLSQDAGIKITGTCSRTNAMKSLRIIARKKYGDNRLRYKFFDKKDILEFKSIVLRNGGNDFQTTMLRDALIAGIAGEGMDVDVQALQPAAVFLNGEYLGMHNIREKVSDHFAEENYGVESDLVDLLEYKGGNKVRIIEGDNTEYNALIDFVKTHSFTVQSNYDKVAEEIDIDNFIDYWIAQIYVGNEDWPNNNNKWWRAKGTNTKWRWILFGAEYSCNVYGGQDPSENSLKRVLDENSSGLGFSYGVNLLIRKLLENEGFKAKFLQRFSYHIDHTFRYARVKEFSDSLRNLVKTEFMIHGKKWYSWLVQNNNWWSDNPYTQWETNMDNLNSWYERRATNVSKHIREYFSITSRYNVSVTASNCANAKFSVNGCPSTANVTGRYFGGINLNLSADLPAGKAVDYWVVTKADGSESTLYDDAIDVVFDGDIKVTLYAKDAPVVYPERTVSATGIYVNEVMARNVGALSDETGHYPGWIEFYNSNDYDVDMAGLFIMDSKTEYQIPGGYSSITTIPAKGHLVFYADGKPELGPLHLSFVLKEDKENGVYLGEIVGGANNYIDYYVAPEMKKNQSYGRATDGSYNLVVFEISTPFAKNSIGKEVEQLPLYTAEKEDPEEEDDYTSVSEQTATHVVKALTVFPNPTSDYITIDSDCATIKYELYAISGKKMLWGDGNRIDMTGLSSGMYVLRVYLGDILQGVKVLKR